MMLGKTMGRSADLAQRFTGESRELAALEVDSRMAGRWMMSTINIAFAIQPAIVYWVAGQSFAHGGGAISIGTLVAFTTLQTRLLFPTAQLLSVGADIEASLALFDRIFEYLDLPVDIVESANPVTLRPSEVLGEVRLEGVGFRYSEDAPWTLEGIDLTVPAGTRAAIVGRTGAGKTTLGYLIARLYEPQSGPREHRRRRRARRELRVARGDRRRRLAGDLPVPRHRAREPALREARRERRGDRAGGADGEIHELIASLPEGYDTVVGERGYRFSGGEKQRIAIARTVLRNPPVLVLDEATSSLDTETEHAVQDALDRLAAGRTTITIAHRLSTIRDAHEIVVLEGGRIVERGTHEQLLERGGRYAELLEHDRVSERLH